MTFERRYGILMLIVLPLFMKGVLKMHHAYHRVAPYNLIQRDFTHLDSAEHLRTTWDVERLIFIQSIQGHAHEGHASFHGSRYPDTSIDDISKALRLDPNWIRTERQHLIDEISTYVDRAIAGDDKIPLCNQAGIGFIGSSMFRGMEISPQDLLRGLYLGGLRDNPEVRFQMEAEYGVVIGGGDCYLVDTDVMHRMGLSEDILAHSAHEDMIEDYRESGLIVGDSGRDGGNIKYLYIRHRRGPGASDDSAIIAAGLLYGFGTAVGVFLADAIDTLEKHVPVFSDQDQDLARKIKENYDKLDVTEAELRHIAYLCATPLDSDIQVPDSSLRHMLLIDRKHDLTAVESHLLFVQGKHYAPIHIGHENALNTDLYSYVADRIEKSPGAK